MDTAELPEARWLPEANVAITAMARKPVTIASLMLKNNELYRDARPPLMRNKFATLGKRGLQSKCVRSSAKLEPCSDS